ncbi:hypothetical protein PCURB6_15020 [Paenibacillus curdlanolyticus]|nr:hypothetical protein PCURB6_15020 [Paenibacillus curdlanolyticus]
MGVEGEALRQWTEIYQFTHPNVTLEYVSVPEPAEGDQENSLDKLKEVLTGPELPDLVWVDLDQIPELASSNLLSPLDPLIKKDHYDTSGIVPAVLEGLRSAGEGTLYALAPQFSASVMIYNKDVFNQAGVDLPSDGMTWGQTFELASRVAKPNQQKPLYGFSFSAWEGGDGFWEAQQYMAPLNVNFFDAKGEKVAVDTPGWAKAWSTIINLKKSGVIPPAADSSEPMTEPEEYNPVQGDLFLSGRTAMAIVDYSYLSDVVQYNKTAAEGQEGYSRINWDIVTVPAHDEAPGVGGDINMNGIFAINANAANPEAAWEFIKLLNSEAWARTKANAVPDMVSWQKYIRKIDGLEYHVEAFFKMKPVRVQPLWSNPVFRSVPRAYEIVDLGTVKFNEALSGQKSVEQALKEWQSEGEAKLELLRQS